MLVLYSFKFKIMWPPLPPPPPPKLKFLTPTPAKIFSEFFNPLPFPLFPKLEGVHALKAQLNLSPLKQNRVQ